MKGRGAGGGRRRLRLAGWLAVTVLAQGCVSAQWICRANLLSAGLRGLIDVDRSMKVGPEADAMSLSFGHNICRRLGITAGLDLARVNNVRYPWGVVLPLHAGISYGAGRPGSPALPVFSLVGSAGIIYGEGAVDVSLVGRADWNIGDVVMPTVEVGWENLGYTFGVSVGLGKWFALGRARAGNE